jgi:hypothetical protein
MRSDIDELVATSKVTIADSYALMMETERILALVEADENVSACLRRARTAESKAQRADWRRISNEWLKLIDDMRKLAASVTVSQESDWCRERNIADPGVKPIVHFHRDRSERVPPK